jgi:hypothetical protein
MMEPLFGSTAPMWTSSPAIGFGYQSPLPVTNGPLSTPLFGSRGLQGVAGGTSGTAHGISPSSGPLFSYPSDPSAVFVGVRSDAMTGMVAAPFLLAAVAMRRGQPHGPTTDQEIEDFIYDAFDLLPGAADVEIRCEGGRATLTGTVQHKRVKRDVGEVAWAIPALYDVQNNVTITSRRRSRDRAAVRETETPPIAAARKQS